jgi:hypothetical protein
MRSRVSTCPISLNHYGFNRVDAGARASFLMLVPQAREVHVALNHDVEGASARDAALHHPLPNLRMLMHHAPIGVKPQLAQHFLGGDVSRLTGISLHSVQLPFGSVPFLSLARPILANVHIVGTPERAAQFLAAAHGREELLLSYVSFEPIPTSPRPCSGAPGPPHQNHIHEGGPPHAAWGGSTTWGLWVQR